MCVWQELNQRAQGEVTIREAIRELELWGAGAVFSLTEYEDSHKQSITLIKDWKELVNQVKWNLFWFWSEPISVAHVRICSLLITPYWSCTWILCEVFGHPSSLFVTLLPEMSRIDTRSQYRMQRFLICRSDILIFGFHQNRVLQVCFCSKTLLLMAKFYVLWQFRHFKL